MLDSNERFKIQVVVFFAARSYLLSQFYYSAKMSEIEYSEHFTYKFNKFGAVNSGIFSKMDEDKHRNSGMLIGRPQTTL